MKESERDEKRAVNPAMRRDPPQREPRDAGEDDRERVKGTQGAELDPRHEGGIAE